MNMENYNNLVGLPPLPPPLAPVKKIGLGI